MFFVWKLFSGLHPFILSNFTIYQNNRNHTKHNDFPIYLKFTTTTLSEFPLLRTTVELCPSVTSELADYIGCEIIATPPTLTDTEWQG